MGTKEKKGCTKKEKDGLWKNKMGPTRTTVTKCKARGEDGRQQRLSGERRVGTVKRGSEKQTRKKRVDKRREGERWDEGKKKSRGLKKSRLRGKERKTRCRGGCK